MSPLTDLLVGPADLAQQLTDGGELGRLLDGLPWLDEPDGERAVVRLRWKPGTNLRIGAVVPTAVGPAAVLVAAFPARHRTKTDKIAGRAAERGIPVHRCGSLVAVPVHGDPELGRLLPGGAADWSYNPLRRWVGRAGDEAIKVHAAAPPRGVGHLLTDRPGRLARHLPATALSRRGRVARTAWVAGRTPTAADLSAVWEALGALHGAPLPGGLPVLGTRSVVTAARAAARSVTAVLPGEQARVDRLVEVLRGAGAAGRWPAQRALVHGDLSPDQVVVTADRAVLLDLDRAAVGPPGWDGAQWTVAQLATGGAVLPPPSPVAPVLLLAAALLRAPEPFRRLRTGWLQQTRALLDTADRVARELS